MAIDLQRSFDATTGIPVSRLDGIDFVSLGDRLDVDALAAAQPEEIVVPPFFIHRENYYAAVLVALACRKAAEADPAIAAAGKNVAASFFQFTREPIYLWQEPPPRDDAISKPARLPVPDYFARQNAAAPEAPAVPPTAEEKTDALFETMRRALAAATRGTPGYVPANHALFEFEEAGRAVL